MPSAPSTTWPSRTIVPLMRALAGFPWKTPPMLAPATKVRNAALAAGAASRCVLFTFTSLVRLDIAMTDSVAGVGVGSACAAASASAFACSALRLAAASCASLAASAAAFAAAAAASSMDGLGLTTTCSLIGTSFVEAGKKIL
jgi:hypothetical protein